MKVFGKLLSIFETNQDMDSFNLDLLTVTNKDFQKMNIHQVEKLLYREEILAKANNQKRNTIMLAKNIRINWKKDKDSKTELDTGENG